MRTAIRFALYAKDEPLVRLPDEKMDRIKVRGIRADEEELFMMAGSVTRVVNFGSILQT